MTEQEKQDYDMQAALMEGYSAGQKLRRLWGRKDAAVMARNHAALWLNQITDDLTYTRVAVDSAIRHMAADPYAAHAEEHLAYAAQKLFHLAGYVAGSRWENTAAHADELAELVSAARKWPTPPAKTEEEVERGL